MEVKRGMINKMAPKKVVKRCD